MPCPSMRRASCSSDATRASRAAASSMPAVVETRTSRCTRSRRGERQVQADPAALRVADERERIVARGGQDVAGDLVEADRSHRPRIAVAAEVGRDGAIACLAEHGQDRIPAAARLCEAVQQHQRLAHPHILPPDDQHLLLRAFADELVRCGVTDVCTSPGSRSTPLVAALTRDGRLRATSHVDERCAAFFALGAAKATGRPVALACTSGTAAANYLPAVVEAHEAGVPLLVLTADRPPELRGVGAGQAIDQIGLYGRSVRWFVEVGNHPATPERVRWMRMLACRAVGATTATRPGPVHLNFPLREPLVAPALGPDPAPGRPGGAPWIDVTAPAPEAPVALEQRPTRCRDRGCGLRPARRRAWRGARAGRCSPTR